MKLHLRAIALVGLIVPRRLRADWRREWEAELLHREDLLRDWDRLDWRRKVELVRRSSAAFWDALLLQPRRLEDDMFQDLRFGARLLARQPVFTLVALAALALGIGANAAVFTLVDKLLIRQLPVERADELVAFVQDAGGAPAVLSYPAYAGLRDRNDVLSGLAAYLQRPFSLSDGSHAERVTGQVVSGNYFTVLGVRPALGRFFASDEDRTPGTHPVVVISHALWQRRFAADVSTIGRTVLVNGYRYTVVGVAPQSFTGTSPGTVTDLYVPTMMQQQAMPGTRNMLASPNAGWLRLIGRLKPGVTRQQAEASLATLARDTAPGGAAGNAKARGAFAWDLFLVDGSRGHTERVDDLSLPLKLLMGVAGFVLLIACANVANLLLARAVTRRKEIAVRLANGASRLRIFRQLLTEGVLLAALGSAAGLAIASRFNSLLVDVRQQIDFVPRTLDGHPDGRVLAFTLGMAIVTALIFALAPARHALTRDVASALNEASSIATGSLRRWSLPNALVVAQVALSLVVLVGAGLCLRSLRALHAVDLGLRPANVVTASFDLGMSGYDEPRGRRFVDDLSARVASLPGVETVGVANIPAFSDLFWIGSASIEGYEPQPNERLAFDFNAVGPGYFRTLGVPMAAGREFTDDDRVGAARVVIVNDALAKRYWPGQDPIGKRIQRGSFLKVVGVVRNSKEKGLIASPRPTIYLPLLQNYVQELTLHVRAADPATLVAGVRRTIQDLDPALPVYGLETLADRMDGSLYRERLAAAMLTVFGLVALVVTAFGLYGTLSYAVAERTREIGIRMALGAPRGDVLKLVVGHGMALTMVGLVVGAAAALGLTRTIQRLLFGVSPNDPATFAIIPALLASVALAACWFPAHRATRLDPLAALRDE